MTTEDFKRKLTAILSADVVGYSRLMGDDETATVKTLEIYKRVMYSLIKQHRGRVVDSPGDNLLAEFGSVVDAVQCAVSIQKELQTRNSELTENRRMDFRIGINLGDVIEEEDRIYGDGVNIAARLEALADPGGICVSKTAFDHIENKLPFGYRFIGEQTVKNIAKPVGAYKVLMETRVVGANEKQKIQAVPFWQRKSLMSIGIIVILAIAVGLYWGYYSQEQSIELKSVEPKQAITKAENKQIPKTIAVLPFEDISPDKDQEYFVDGLSEEIINSLTQIPKLGVTGRTSSFTFKGSNRKTQEIANELGVDHILEGSVRKSGNSLRITAQLIRAVDDLHLWSKTYDKDYNVKEIFAIQEDIANRVAHTLRLTIESINVLGGTEKIEAYELYLKAKDRRSRIDGKSPLELIEEAITLDPEFAIAWAVKSRILIVSNFMEAPDSYSTMRETAAKRAAEKAIEIEPNITGGYAQLGYINAVNGEWLKAGFNLNKALELTNDSLSGDDRNIIFCYMAVGKLKKTNELLDEIRRNDPINQDISDLYYLVYAYIGERQRAEEEYRRNNLSSKDVSERYDLFITDARLCSGDVLSSDEIIDSYGIHSLGKKYLDSPVKGLVELRRIYASNEKLSPYDLLSISRWAVYFGDIDFAMQVSEKAASINALHVSTFWTPLFKEVRQLPRFKEYVREIGLVDYWKEYGWPDLCHPVGDDDFVCD